MDMRARDGKAEIRGKALDMDMRTDGEGAGRIVVPGVGSKRASWSIGPDNVGR